MFNKDYIMRMIEQLVQGIALIMRLKQENRLEECADALSGTLRKFYGLNEQSVDLLPWQDLMALASLGGLPDAEKCALLAQLVKEKADLERLRGSREKAAGLYEKALNLYVAALLYDPAWATPEHRQRVDELVALAGEAGFAPETKDALCRYHESAGNYGKAEDMLYELRGWEDRAQPWVVRAREFYLRLLERDDGDLERGNLPRQEVLEALRRLPAAERTLEG